MPCRHLVGDRWSVDETDEPAAGGRIRRTRLGDLIPDRHCNFGMPWTHQTQQRQRGDGRTGRMVATWVHLHGGSDPTSDPPSAKLGVKFGEAWMWRRKSTGPAGPRPWPLSRRFAELCSGWAVLGLNQ